MSDTEKALLGAVFLDNSAWETVSAIVRPEDFATYSHTKVYRTMAALFEAGTPVDLRTVAEACDVPAHEIAGLTSAVPSSSNARYYADIVHNTGTKRNAVRVLREAQEKAMELDTATEIVEYIESRIFELHEHMGGQYRHVREHVAAAVDEIEANYRAHQAGTTVGVATGLRELDELTSGLRKQDLVIIGARASIGKTALGLSIAANVSKTTPCAFFSLEMSGSAITQRLISNRGKIHLTRLRNGTLRTADFKDLTDAAGRVYSSNLWIYDVSNARLSDIKSKARRLVMREGIKVLVVDYIGLIRTDGKFDKRNEEVGHITRELKQLARELDIPIVALAQLNRNAEGKVPSLAELAESGNIEQDADVIMLLHRDRMSTDTKTLCSIVKSRNGATGNINLAFLQQYAMFQDYCEEIA
jgi:replicative DNA helicase